MLEDSYGNFWIGIEGGGLFWYLGDVVVGLYIEFVFIVSFVSVFVLEEIEENG